MKKTLLPLVPALAIAAFAADDVDYGFRNPGWALTPDAAKLLEEWEAKPYERKNGRTDLFIRAQLKYGIQRDNYLHHWYDRPLLQDSSLAEKDAKPKSWLVDEGWRRTVEMARLGKIGRAHV